MIGGSLEGIGFHALGAASASGCYLPYHRTRGWSWISFWLVQALFAWILAPLVLALVTVPDFFSILRTAPAGAVWAAFWLGACYGFGGMSFGMATRYIGYSLTYTISIGLSAVLGTILPLLWRGGLTAYFSQPGAGIVLAGMILSLVGVAGCGMAGLRKEKEGGATQGFLMRKGLALTVVAGVLSAVFNISLELGQPLADLAGRAGAGIFRDNAKLVVSTAGCFLVNAVWFTVAGWRNGRLRELTPRGSGGVSLFWKNFLWSALGGVMWCMQFFFYGLGHVKMGRFGFASWIIHMSMLIFFSFAVGMARKEWKQVSPKTYRLLVCALVLLWISFCIMAYGSLPGTA